MGVYKILFITVVVVVDVIEMKQFIEIICNYIWNTFKQTFPVLDLPMALLP